MLPEKHVWIFIEEHGGAPGGVFSSRQLAEQWIRANRLSGTLSAYPLDEGCFDWALRNELVTGTAKTRGNDPVFIGSFTSASQEHYHYEHGEE